ncbi:MAG: hypothetical protein ACFFAS_04250 [Promethearchaeota archaeon]
MEKKHLIALIGGILGIIGLLIPIGASFNSGVLSMLWGAGTILVIGSGESARYYYYHYSGYLFILIISIGIFLLLTVPLLDKKEIKSGNKLGITNPIGGILILLAPIIYCAINAAWFEYYPINFVIFTPLITGIIGMASGWLIIKETD